MAAIGKIRSWGPVLIAVLAIALFGFIAETGFEVLGKFRSMDANTAGIVDGKKVTFQPLDDSSDDSYNKWVEEYEALLKLQGQDNLSEQDRNDLRDFIWNNFVNNTAVEKEAKKLGLTVTDEELVQVLKEGTNPALSQIPVISMFINPQTRRFDYSQVNASREYLKNMAAQSAEAQQQYQLLESCWPIAEKLLRQQLLTNKYQTLLMGCITSNPVQAKASFDEQNVESTVLLAALPYSSVNDNDVEVSDADLKAKYNELKKQFKVNKEVRNVKYVYQQVVASAADRAKLSEEINEAVANFKGDKLSASEVVRAARSVIAYNGLPVTRRGLPVDVANRLDSMAVGQVSDAFESSDNTMNVIKYLGKVQAPDSVEFRAIQFASETVADSALQALKAGAVFDSIAKKYGQSGEKAWRTSANYQTSGSIDVDTKNFFNTLFNLGTNELKNIKMAQGNLLVQVTDRKAFVDKFDVAIVKREITFSNDTYNKMYNDFSQYVSESKNLDGLVEKAGEFKYSVQDRAIVNDEHLLAAIPGSHDALKWVFSEAKKGDVSAVIPCGNNDGLLVVALEKVIPVGYADQESKADELKQAVILDKKFEQLAKKFEGVNDIAAAQKAGAAVDTLKLITFRAPAYVQAYGAAEPALSGAVAGTAKGKFSKTAVKGNQAAYKFLVLDRKNREGAQYDAKAQQLILRQQNVQQVMSLSIQALRDKLEIVDNRYMQY